MTLPDEIQAVMPRLERLRTKTGANVNLDTRVWLWTGDAGRETTISYEVWLSATADHYKADTLDAAVALAEAALGIPRLIHSADCTPEPFGAHLDACDGTGCDREMLREAIEIEAEEQNARGDA